MMRGHTKRNIFKYTEISFQICLGLNLDGS